MILITKQLMRLHSNHKGRHSLNARSLLDTKDRLFQIWIISCFVLFLGVGFSGITTSSFSIIQAQSISSPTETGPLFGEARVIRTDEYRRSTPWKIGVLKSGGTDFQSPLASTDNSLVFPDPDSWIDSLSAIDSVWPRLVPVFSISQKLAFSWWTPTLLALIALPLFLRRVGASTLVSISATITILFSPVNAWWSLSISPIIGYSALASYAFIKGSDLIAKSAKRAIAAFLVVGFSVVKLITCYQPWVIVIASITLIPTFFYTSKIYGYRNSLKSFSLSGVFFLLPATAFLYSNLSGIQTIQNTVYPGIRRATGEYVSAALTWGAPHLQLLDRTPDLIGTNPSELSSSMTVMIFASLATYLILRIQKQQIGLQTSSLFIFFIWLAWVTIPWPIWSVKIPLMSLVEPNRAAVLLGILATIIFAYTSQSKMSKNLEFSRIKIFSAITVAIFSFLVTVSGGRNLQEIMPRLGEIRIFTASILMAGIAFCLVLEKTRIIGWLGISIFSLVLTINVNPIQRNLNGLATGEVANNLNALAQHGSAWASDDLSIDALLMANSISSLSGQQMIGPNVEQWRILDPDDEYIGNWNRGASYINFNWQQEEAVTITSDYIDIIVVSANPCLLAKSFSGLDFIASNKQLSFTCLSQVYQFAQNGVIKNVYVLDRG